MENKMQKYHNDGLFTESLQLMDELRHQRKFCDVTLKVEDQSYSAHRIILAGTIPYFRAMFTNNMAESRMEEITMKEIDPCALECLINYAYTATVEIDKQNAQNLLMAASFLQLDKVRDACVDFLISHLEVHDVLGLRQRGDLLNCNNLVQAADVYINGHFSEIAELQEFRLLTSDQVIEIIQRDGLSVQEERIFEACMRWVKYNREERSEQFPAVFSRVRLPLLTPQYLVDHVCNEELVETSPECRKLVEEAKNYHLLLERAQQLQSFRTRPRCTYEQFFIVGLSDSKFATVEIFDSFTGKLTEGPSIGLSNTCFARGAAVGAKVYLFDEDVLIYDCREKTWSIEYTAHPPHEEEAVAVLNQDIYLCGGNDGYQSFLTTVSVYDVETRDWRIVAPMLQGRERASAISLDKFVYVLGGYSGNSTLDSVERYDPANDIWKIVKSMLNKRSHFGTAALKGKLYACGGHDGKSWLQTVEVYHPVTDTWNLVAPMNHKRGKFGLIPYANKLWAIGGCDDEGELTSVEVYDPETNKWTVSTPMNIPKSCIGAGIILA